MTGTSMKSFGKYQSYRHARLGIGLCGLFALLGGCHKTDELCPKGYDVEITGNHGHEFVAPKEKGKSYALTGGTHEHRVVVKDTDIAKLREGGTATPLTTSTNAHTHQVSMKCKP